MADFVKLDGYNVKDALAGKSLSISGDQLSLLKADGTAASTVTIPKGMKVYHVTVQYKDTVTDQTQYPSILDAIALGQGSWSILHITEELTGTALPTTTKIEDLIKDGLVYATAYILFTAQGTNYWHGLDTHILDDPSYIAFTISNGVPHYVQGWLSISINAHTNAVTTSSITKVSGGSSTLAGLSDVNVTSATNGQVLTYDSNSGEWVPTTPSGGSGNPDAIIGSIAVDMTGENITTSSFAPVTNTPIAVDTMTKLRLSVKSPQGWPPELGSLTPSACAIKAGSSAVYDTIQAAVDAGDGSNITDVVLYYNFKPSGWVKINLTATYSNGSITITGGTASIAQNLVQ